jgi:hypothetical protein
VVRTGSAVMTANRSSFERCEVKKRILGKNNPKDTTIIVNLLIFSAYGSLTPLCFIWTAAA